jgi:large subunit ribosomal protein L15
VNVSRLVVFGEGSRIDPAALVERGLARSGHRIKILGNGEVTVRLTVLAHAFSAGASAKIAAAGGSVELIEGAQKLDA